MHRYVEMGKGVPSKGHSLKKVGKHGKGQNFSKLERQQRTHSCSGSVSSSVL